MLQSKLKVGELDRRIIIQVGTNSTDDYNAPTVTWSTFATVWAKLVDTPFGSRESYEADQLTAIRQTTFLIRYLEGVKEQMRILYDDRIYDIEFIGNNDRKRTLELKTILLDET